MTAKFEKTIDVHDITVTRYYYKGAKMGISYGGSSILIDWKSYIQGPLTPGRLGSLVEAHSSWNKICFVRYALVAREKQTGLILSVSFARRAARAAHVMLVAAQQEGINLQFQCIPVTIFAWRRVVTTRFSKITPTYLTTAIYFLKPGTATMM